MLALAGGKRFGLALVVVWATLAAPASAATLYTTLDQPSNIVGTNSDAANQPHRLAQAFVPTTSGTARTMSVHGQRLFGTGSGTIQLSINADGANPGAVLGKGTGTIYEETQASPTCVVLDTPVSLTAGQSYYAVFGGASGNANWVFWREEAKQVQKSYEENGGWNQDSGGPQKTVSLRVDTNADCGPELRTNPQPGTLVDDMYATPGGTAFQTVVAHNDGPANLVIDDYGFSGPNADRFRLLRGEPDGPDNGMFPVGEAIGSGGLAIMYVACYGDAPDGPRTAQLNLFTNDGIVTFPVECLVDATPPTLTFSQTPDGLSGWWKTSPATLAVTGVDPESGGRVKRVFCTDTNGPFLDHDTSPFASFQLIADGIHHLGCQATDVADNTTAPSVAAQVKIDTGAPSTSAGDGPPALTKSTSAQFEFTGADGVSGLLETQCRLDGGSYTTCTSPAHRSAVPDGLHEFEVRATDVAGNVEATAASFVWRIDTTPPDTAITSSPLTLTTHNHATFEYAATDAVGVAGLECSLDGAAFATCTTPYVATELLDGEHTFAVRAADTVGNVESSPALHQWSIDRVAPQSAFTQKPAASSAGPEATFSFAGTDLGPAGVASFACKLDDGAYAPCTSPVVLTGLQVNHDHTFAIKATDVLGQEQASATSYTWTITDDPLARPDSTTTMAGVPVAVDVLANDFAAVGGALSLAAFDATASHGGTVVEAGGKLHFMPAAGFTGTDSFTYRARDAQGQESAPGTVTIAVAPAPASAPGAIAWAPLSGARPRTDIAAPVLSKLRLSKRIIRFTSSEVATATLTIRKGRQRARITKAVVAGANRVTVPRKFRRGRLRLTLKAVDAAGNRSRALTRLVRLTR